LHPGSKKITQDREQRAQVQCNIEGETRISPAEKPGRKRQVGSAADWKKFRDALNDGQHDHLIDRHDVRMDMVTRPASDVKSAGHHHAEYQDCCDSGTRK